MTVKELIDLLYEFDPNDNVSIQIDISEKHFYYNNVVDVIETNPGNVKHVAILMEGQV